MNPKDDQSYHGIGNVYLAQKKYHKAIDNFKKATKINPKNDSAWCDMGTAYYNLKNYKKAVNFYNKAIDLNPDNEDYKKLRDDALEKMK